MVNFRMTQVSVYTHRENRGTKELRMFLAPQVACAEEPRSSSGWAGGCQSGLDGILCLTSLICSVASPKWGDATCARAVTAPTHLIRVQTISRYWVAGFKWSHWSFKDSFSQTQLHLPLFLQADSRSKSHIRELFFPFYFPSPLNIPFHTDCCTWSMLVLLSMQSLIPFLTVIKSCHQNDLSFFHVGFRVMFNALNLSSDSDAPEKALLSKKSSSCGQGCPLREQQLP